MGVPINYVNQEVHDSKEEQHLVEVGSMWLNKVESECETRAQSLMQNCMFVIMLLSSNAVHLAASFKIHTSPVEEFGKVCHRGIADLQMYLFSV